MLPPVAVVMSSQWLLGLRICPHPANCIELVISEHALCRPSFAHGTNQTINLDLLWAAIDQISNEQCRSIPVSIGATALSIPHLLKQRAKMVCIAMHISNHVDTDIDALLCKCHVWLPVP